jgi:hypothetical protein
MESLDSTALVGPIRKEIDLNYVDMSSKCLDLVCY